MGGGGGGGADLIYVDKYVIVVSFLLSSARQKVLNTSKMTSHSREIVKKRSGNVSPKF